MTMQSFFCALRRSSSHLHVRPAALAWHAARCRRFKTTKTGEEGQFKAVTASQSAHEPTYAQTFSGYFSFCGLTVCHSEDMLSKPPHKAARQEVKRQTPTKWGSKEVDATEKKNKTDRL